ncbi:MAG: PorP/SprF family type IX secretion system membrane protein [Saprospiraceae bacterium]
MTIKFRYLFLGIFLMMMHWCAAQHVMQNSLYMFDRYAFNPAFGGMESSLVANFQYRTQWAGIPGNPESYMIDTHMPFYLWQGAIGLELFNESIGAEKQTSFLVSYNYIRETSFGLFSLGLRAGLSQNSLDGAKLRAPDGFYEGGIIDHQDIDLPNGAVSGISPLFETGLYYAGDYFEAGLSMTGYYPGGIDLGEGIHSDPRPGFHFFGEYFIESFDQISIYPIVYIKSDLIETQAELSVRAEWQNIATAGIGYRGFGNNNLDALILSAGVRLSPKFYLNYAYDLGLSSLNSAHQGSHEILIRYNLGKKIGAGLPPRTIYNPRNL